MRKSTNTPPSSVWTRLAGWMTSAYKSVVIVILLAGMVCVYNSLLIRAITRKVGGVHTFQAAAPRYYIGTDEEIW